MSTHADPAAPPAVGARPRPRRPSPWRRLLRLGCWGPVFTLIGLNAWWVWDDRLDEPRQALWRAYDMAGPIDRPAILVMLLRTEFERIAHEEAAATLRRYVHATPDDWEARRALAIEEQWAGHEHAAESNIQA